MFMKGDQILSAFSNLLLLFVFCLFFAACGMNTLRVSSRSDSKNVTPAFKEPVEIADEEPDSRRRSCAHTKESANKECPESSDRKQQQQQQQPSTSSNSDQTATADNNFAEAFEQPNINGAKRLSYEMRSDQLSSKKRESFQVTPEGFDLERVRATISAFEQGEADSHDVSRCFGFGLDLSSSIPSLKPEILFDVGDDALKSPGLSTEDWLGTSDASSNRELSMRCMDLKASLVAGAPFHCFDRLCDFISGTDEFKSTLNIFRTKAKDEPVPQAKRRWVLSQV